MVARAIEIARRERVLLLLAAGFVLFRVIGFLDVEPRISPDGVAYDNAAKEPILSADFLAGGRPPTLPLLYKVVTGNDARIWTQLAISIACWLALAAAVAASIGARRLRPLAFGAVLVFALADHIVLWDARLLAESVSLSLLAALVAAWLWIVRRPSPCAYGVMLALALAWALARDLHAYALLGLALALTLSIAVSRDWGGTRGLRATAALGLIAIAAASYASANADFARWAFPLQNTLALRISTEPDQLAYFEDAGMPVTPELLAAFEGFRERGIALEYPPVYDTEEALRNASPFHRWLRTEGRETYTRFLLTHPGVVVEALEYDHLVETLLNPPILIYASHASPWNGRPLVDAIYPPGPRVAIAWLVLALALAAYVGWRFGPRREWLVPGFLLAACLPLAIIVWHAGALQPDRHGLLPSVFLRLGALLLFLFAVDRWLQARDGADRTPARSSSPGRS
jgi:hypothetical protein